MSLGKELEERLAELKNALLTPDGAGVEEQEANLEEVVTLYENATSGQKEVATEIRQVFLLTLIETPDILAKEKFAAFLGEHIQPEDFSRLEWEAPEEVVSMCETLYGFHFDDESVSKGVREQVLNLLRCSLQQFEERGELEKMLQLLRLAPILPDIMDAELMRLRSRAYLYEMRRIQRNRRILYGYLILQVLLIFIVFPFLFINAENRAIQQQIEELTEVDLSPPERLATSRFQRRSLLVHYHGRIDRLR